MPFGQQMNTEQSQIVDPILTGIVRGYKQPGNVGHTLFPTVNITVLRAKIVKFGAEAFMIEDTRRAPGGKTGRTHMGQDSDPVVLEHHSLDVGIPREEVKANEVPGIPIVSKKLNTVMRKISLKLEKEQADAARNAANYGAGNKFTASGSTRWSDPTSDPLGQMADARSSIRSQTGVYPNVAVISAKAFEFLKFHPALVELYKHTRAGILTPKIVADVLQLQRLEIGGSMFTTTADASAGFTDVWGDDAIMAYVPQNSLGTFDEEEPSYGYTYTDADHPMVEEIWYDRLHKEWVAGGSLDRQIVLAGASAGFLMTDVGDDS